MRIARLSLYDLMINKKEAKQAVAEFFAPKYIQHNPMVPDGAAELARFFDKIAKDPANLRIVIHRIVAIDDYVWAHVQTQTRTKVFNNELEAVFRFFHLHQWRVQRGNGSPMLKPGF